VVLPLPPAAEAARRVADSPPALRHRYLDPRAGTAVSPSIPTSPSRLRRSHHVQEANQVLTGVPTLKTNTIEVLSSYSQSFPIGTASRSTISASVASNTPYNLINPELYSNFQLIIQQPILAGSASPPTNAYPHCQAQLPDHRPCFQAQVIAP